MKTEPLNQREKSVELEKALLERNNNLKKQYAYENALRKDAEGTIKVFIVLIIVLLFIIFNLT